MMSRRTHTNAPSVMGKRTQFDGQNPGRRLSNNGSDLGWGVGLKKLYILGQGTAIREEGQFDSPAKASHMLQSTNDD